MTPATSTPSPAAAFVAIPAPTPTEWARLYARSGRRAIRKYGVAPSRVLRRIDDRPVFIVGSTRSGTSFTAESIGTMPGFSELGELRPLKRVIPQLFALPVDEAAGAIRTIIGRAQRIGMVAGLRAVETTPECTYLIPAIVRAFPNARFVHMTRDGRDVAASLVGLGWLKADAGSGADEVGHVFGNHSRFWVEPGREADFVAASDVVRAAWVWRRYDTVAREHLRARPGQGIEIRYEDLIDDSEGCARRLAGFLGADDHVDALIATITDTVSASARGRWQRELSPEQLAEVRTEAGGLLDELGYS